MKYLIPLEDAFQENANLENAFFMKKYMKGLFEFYGIKTPGRKLLCRQFLNKYGKPDMKELISVIKHLWNKPQREFQYFAISLMDKNAKIMERDIIKLIEYTIINKSWWDTVDAIASNVVGPIFNNYPDMIKPYTDKWMASENIWLQRSVLLFQLKYKDNTNTELLYKSINELSVSKEFFIQKAIGWALRQYSKTNPKSVRLFIENSELAALSVREGMKIIRG